MSKDPRYEVLDHQFLESIRNNALAEMLMLYPQIEESIMEHVQEDRDNLHALNTLHALIGNLLGAPRNGTNGPSSPSSVDQLLINDVYEGKPERIPGRIQQVTESFISEQLDTMDQWLPLEKERMLTIADSIVQQIYDAQVCAGLSFVEDLNYRQRISSAGSVDQLKEALQSVFVSLAEYFKLRQSSMQSLRAESIKQYIDERFCSPNLCIGMISNDLGMSQSHISRIFKSEFGESVLVYINRMRIRWAKLLLEKTDRTVADIATSVGYLSSQSFIRAFKNSEGVSPGQYRSSAIERIG